MTIIVANGFEGGVKPSNWDGASGSVQSDGNGGYEYAFTNSQSHEFAAWTAAAADDVMVAQVKVTIAAVDATYGFLGLGHGLASWVGVHLNADGSISVQRYTGTALSFGTVLGTSDPGVMSFGTAHYVAFKASIHNSTGTIDVEVDGVSVLSLSGIDTANSSTSTEHRAKVLSRNATDLIVDDVIVCDAVAATGTETWDDIFAPVKILGLTVEGADTGDDDYVGSDANSVNNYQLVDEIPFASADYVEDSPGVATNRQMFNVEDVPSGTVPLGIQMIMQAQNPDGGSNAVVMEIDDGVTAGQSSSVGLAGSSTHYEYLLLQAPTTGDWTETQANALTVGVETS